MGGKTVAPWMRQTGLRARGVRRYKTTADSRHDFPVADNVLAQRFMAASRSHAVWMGVMTDIGTDEGWLYLATLED